MIKVVRDKQELSLEQQDERMADIFPSKEIIGPFMFVLGWSLKKKETKIVKNLPHKNFLDIIEILYSHLLSDKRILNIKEVSDGWILS